MKEAHRDTLTYLQAKRELAAIGITINRNHDQPGEYRVNFKGGAESTAYYTTGLRDALSTGIDMAKRGARAVKESSENKPIPYGDLEALLFDSGFKQNVKKSIGNFTWWERDNASAITSDSGYLLWVGENSMGGSTPTHLAEHLKALKTAKLLTLTQVAVLAEHIYQQHDIAAAADAGFDAGEYSGPAHGRMVDAEIAALAQKFGYTVEEVDGEMLRRQHEHDGGGQ